jgi:hypothetical protein
MIAALGDNIADKAKFAGNPFVKIEELRDPRVESPAKCYLRCRVGCPATTSSSKLVEKNVDMDVIINVATNCTQMKKSSSLLVR